jgi:flagellar biosynthesis chaperone FliJ
MQRSTSATSTTNLTFVQESYRRNTTTNRKATHNSHRRNTQQQISPLHTTVTTVTKTKYITATNNSYNRITNYKSHHYTQELPP